MIERTLFFRSLVDKVKKLVDQSTRIYEHEALRSLKICGPVVELVDALDSERRLKKSTIKLSALGEILDVEPPKFGEGLSGVIARLLMPSQAEKNYLYRKIFSEGVETRRAGSKVERQ